MDNPSISVILPAYNCERFIGSAVQSVLSQTTIDFELIIIDDGSTDHTAEVIRGITDKRIRFYRNDRNSGLVYTLNRGVALAKGDFIARMDGDDLCKPSRFEVQLEYLRQHPETGLVTSTADLIDEDNSPAGTWTDDRRTLSAESIRRFLPKNNCIVHPAVMIRSSLIKKYGFLKSQAQAEDYDLWLRLTADRIRIDKIAEPLLLHRILRQSFTRKRQKNVFWKNATTKLRFVAGAISNGRMNGFVLRVFAYGLADLAFGLGKKIKSIIKN